MNFDEQLQKYADVILKAGLNLRAGQRLWLRVDANLLQLPPESVKLIHTLVERAYSHGASFVYVLWRDQSTLLTHLLHAPNFDEFPTWEIDGALSFIENGDAYLTLAGRDPDLLSRVPAERMREYQMKFARLTKPVSGAISAAVVNWLYVGLPVTGWARRVFPNLTDTDAISKLWQAIFEVCRVNEPDPAQAWIQHIDALARRRAYLTAKQYTALRYRAPGTDLTVGLPAGHVWQGGSLTAKNGITFTPNIPTEEVFTMPHRLKVDGTVSASMPLVTTDVIEGLRFTFKDGVVTEVHADRNQALVENLISIDEGARMLGEVALVPHSSPIGKFGLFYETLYDENASNHLAIGSAYRSTLEGGEMMDEESFRAEGGNISMVHTDFMIGSAAMDVDGVLHNGSTEPIMRAGEWAF